MPAGERASSEPHRRDTMADAFKNTPPKAEKLGAMTEENLKAAFAGESQASQKYLAFAAKADAEGYPNIGRLFRAVAYAESTHARNHLSVLGGIGDTAAKDHQAIYDATGKGLGAGNDLGDSPVRVCPICGHTVIGDAPDECPVCG